MGFPGTWMTESETVIYRVVPKCACSTIGQILHFSDHGAFYDGDIHDSRDGLHKWAFAHSQPIIERAVTGQQVFTFTCVRNPYTRILSSFFDKICGVQRNGKTYRGDLVPMLAKRYGVEVEGDFDQIKSFRRFLLFVRDTIRFRKPIDPDIHWSYCAGHVSTLVRGGGRYNAIFPMELFDDGMAEVLTHIPARHSVDLPNIPRFNESQSHGPKRAHPVEDYFDDLANHIMLEIYRKDFNLFRYAKEPNANPPKGEIDLDEVHAKLAA